MSDNVLKFIITHEEMIGILDAFINFDSKALNKIMNTVRERRVD